MDNELDEGMVEKARAAFEAMTKVMLDAGRRYEERTTALTADTRAGRTQRHRGEAMTCDHDHDDGLGMLTARDTLTPDRPVEQERDEFERRYATVLRNLNVAQQELADLRAGIEALAGDPTAQDETGTWIDRKRVADLLAGSGEPLGACDKCSRPDDGNCNCPLTYDPAKAVPSRPAPVVPDTLGLRLMRRGLDEMREQMVPDSPDVRAVTIAALDAVQPTWRATGREPSEDDLAWTRAVLAVVGQGVTAEQAWDEGYLAAIRDVTPNAPLGGANPYRAVVRSGKQGGEG